LEKLRTKKGVFGVVSKEGAIVMMGPMERPFKELREAGMTEMAKIVVDKI